LPRSLRCYPAKNYQRKASNQSISGQKETKKTTAFKVYKCHGKTLESGLRNEINSNKVIKAPISLHRASLCIQVIEQVIASEFEPNL